MVSYNKLWKLLIDKRMKKKDLAEAAGISANTIAKMGRDALVSLEVLVRICRALKCDIGDIVEVLPNSLVPGEASE
ncbi:MAG: helix-turn-helix transcriptional regulator [Lachnospiraceae bacterium]|nr:helix-turn-helix transcriptional regulator [Lachnospiraceae bacterium]